LNQHIQQFGFCVQAASSDAGTLASDAPPPFFGTQGAEPEGKSAALHRPNIINDATVFKKETAPLIILFDAVAVFIWIKVSGGKTIDRHMEGRGDRLDFRRGDIDCSVFTHATVAALLAAETKALIKKIRPVLKFSKGDKRHGLIISGRRSAFNYKIPFT
jgi:hypothetical protein